MDALVVTEILLLFLCLVFSAFFSGSETAFFSTDKTTIKSFFSSHPLLQRYSLALIEYPKRLLITILIGNNLVNIASAIISVSLSVHAAHAFDLSMEVVILFQIVILTAVLLIFSEIVPKVFAAKQSLRFIYYTVVPLYWISILLFPVAEIVSELIQSVFKGKALDKSKSALSTDDLTHLVEIGTQKGSLEGEEKELIKGVVEARDTIVRQVMMPRVDITAVEADTALEEVLELIRSTGHSRIPVYEEDLDTVIGVLYMKDLLPYLSPSADREKFSVQSLIRTPLFVPEYRPVTNLLQEFQEKKTHIAVVVDEYGGTSGIVTMEDLLEAIVGDIKDELDTDSDEITSTDDQTYILQGSATIDEVNEALSISLDVYNEEYDTISGFILKEAGRIPKRGFSVEHEGFKFTVTEIINNRIQIITAKRCRK